MNPIAPKHTLEKGDYHRMSLVIEPDWHRAFKMATAREGKKMTALILQFIKDYVRQHMPEAVPPKGGKK